MTLYTVHTVGPTGEYSARFDWLETAIEWQQHMEYTLGLHSFITIEEHA